MEFVIAPIAELRAELTRMFEDRVAAGVTPDRLRRSEHSALTCGLTGGSTALIFLGSLREAAVDWARVAIYWGDERAVPPDHPDSNFALAERLLILPLGGRAPAAFRMPADLPDLDRAAEEYDRALPPSLDLLILGVGEDGHLCSLFPDHPALAVKGKRVIAITDAPKPPPHRLTLTLPYVVSSREIWVVAVGSRKLPVLRQAMGRRSTATPLDLVMAQARSVVVFTDQGVTPV